MFRIMKYGDKRILQYREAVFEKKKFLVYFPPSGGGGPVGGIQQRPSVDVTVFSHYTDWKDIPVIEAIPEEGNL